MVDPTRIALRLHLASGLHSIPLHRVHHLTGYATLSGEPDDYFLGWLTFHGTLVPVFDLDRLVCDHATPENFGARILILEAPAAPTRYLGLLASGMTDTLAPGPPQAGDAQATPLDLDAYLPMLSTLIPPVPARA